MGSPTERGRTESDIKIFRGGEKLKYVRKEKTEEPVIKLCKF
jgi:hypothetical protein